MDEELIHEAKVLAAQEGTSVSAMVAKDLREKLAARVRYEDAMGIALESMAEAASSDRQLPSWNREELYDRW